jgi:hypothetical protein
MPNPEEIIGVAKAIELATETAPEVRAGLNLVSLSHTAEEIGSSVRSGMQFESLLAPGTKGLMLESADLVGDPVTKIVLSAGEKAGLPMAVDSGKIAKVSTALGSGDLSALETGLRDTLFPTTYAERMAFYGG